MVPPLADRSASSAISAALRTGAGFTVRPNGGAASRVGCRKIVPRLAAVSGLNTRAIRVTRGAICFSASSHLPAIEGSKLVNPVMFPPGCAQLSTKPLETGSETSAKTIGILRVASLSAATLGVGLATITSGADATSSAV